MKIHEVSRHFFDVKEHQSIAGENDRNPAILKRVPLHAGLPMAAPHGTQAVGPQSGSQESKSTAPETEETIDPPGRVGIDRDAMVILGGELCGVGRLAVADRVEGRPPLLDGRPNGFEASNLLAAKQSAEVSQEDQDRRAVSPQTGEADLFSSGIQNRRGPQCRVEFHRLPSGRRLHEHPTQPCGACADCVAQNRKQHAHRCERGVKRAGNDRCAGCASDVRLASDSHEE